MRSTCEAQLQVIIVHTTFFSCDFQLQYRYYIAGGIEIADTIERLPCGYVLVFIPHLLPKETFNVADHATSDKANKEVKPGMTSSSSSDSSSEVFNIICIRCQLYNIY